MRPKKWRDRFSFYIDTSDWWIGVYRAEGRIYICLLPCCVVKVVTR